jgi:ABC-type uncharacterized transport system involved in gliding motility auxiliary subunit
MKPASMGRICGALGLILLAWSGLIWVVFSSTPLVLAHVTVAVILIGVFLATNLREIPAFASSRGAFYVFLTGFGTLFLLLAIVFGNYMAKKKDIAWDVTKNKLHTLSPDTQKTLENLKSEVTVLAFFSAGDQNMDVASELLNKYTRLTDKLKVQWIDPVKDPVMVKKYGIRKDGGHRLVVLYPSPKEGETKAPTEQRVNDITEEGLTNAIVKVTHQSEKVVYFVTGHNEADLDDTQGEGLSEVKKRMEGEGLKAQKLNLASTQEIPKDAGAVVLPGPLVDLAPAETETLRKYLNQGGRALFMVEPQTSIKNLTGLLKEWAIEPDEAVIVDPLSRLFGAGVIAPVVQDYPEHEITKDFRLNTVFPTARPLTILHDTPGVTAKPLALTLQSSWAETNIEKQPIEHDENEKSGPLPVAAVITKDTKSAADKRSDEARLVVFGDRDFATNQYHLAFGNEDFFLNCLNWLVEQTDRITIRPRLRDASRLFLTETQSTAIFVGAIEVPVLILIAGLWVWMTRRAR